MPGLDSGPQMTKIWRRCVITMLEIAFIPTIRGSWPKGRTGSSRCTAPISMMICSVRPMRSRLGSSGGTQKTNGSLVTQATCGITTTTPQRQSTGLRLTRSSIRIPLRMLWSLSSVSICAGFNSTEAPGRVVRKEPTTWVVFSRIL